MWDGLRVGQWNACLHAFTGCQPSPLVHVPPACRLREGEASQRGEEQRIEQWPCLLHSPALPEKQEDTAKQGERPDLEGRAIIGNNSGAFGHPLAPWKASERSGA